MTSNSVYKIDYRKPSYSRRTIKQPTNANFTSHPEDGLWIEGEVAITSENYDEVQRKINRMYRDRNVSTYQKEICHMLDKRSNEEYTFQNQMKQYGIKTFSLRDRYVLPPVATARVINGYMNPKNFRTDNTGYEIDYCFRGLKTLYPDEDFQGRSELQDKVLKEWHERQKKQAALWEEQCKSDSVAPKSGCSCLINR